MDRDRVMVTMREVAPEVLGVEPDVVVEEANFKDDLDADSLDLVELVMGLEERLDVTIPEEELAGIKTVGQAVDLVVAKLAVKT
jgi:acyl carrier protein